MLVIRGNCRRSAVSSAVDPAFAAHKFNKFKHKSAVPQYSIQRIQLSINITKLDWLDVWPGTEFPSFPALHFVTVHHTAWPHSLDWYSLFSLDVIVTLADLQF